jgi:superfamily II DNA or RNA helicase
MSLLLRLVVKYVLEDETVRPSMDKLSPEKGQTIGSSAQTGAGKTSTALAIMN